MTASKIVKNSTSPVQTLTEVTASTEIKKKELLEKLEIVKTKVRLIQEQIDFIEFSSNLYDRSKIQN